MTRPAAASAERPAPRSRRAPGPAEPLPLQGTAVDRKRKREEEQPCFAIEKNTNAKAWTERFAFLVLLRVLRCFLSIWC